MNYWLLKTEPSCFGLADLQQRPNQREPWDGVRNYQARNLLRDAMRRGDQAFLYHSSCKIPAVVAIVEIVRAGHPDPTAFDPQSRHFDPASDPAAPRWYQVDIQLIRPLRRPISLTELRQRPELDGLELLRRGSRLSVQPVAERHWHAIMALEDAGNAR
ncbi:MAG: EVE domain-containing protein [Desulfuromonas thiophila]|jgi:predicted RNA-binding protein with PUA-like domain|nr:EVE domain-containing protein [Desulfuromonas thiophila]